MDGPSTALGHAFEVDLQFGDEAADDPSVHAMIDRRVRIGAWTRVFLTELDAARPPALPIAEPVLAWMGDRQVQLADTIFAMDRKAKSFAARQTASGHVGFVRHRRRVLEVSQDDP